MTYYLSSAEQEFMLVALETPNTSGNGILSDVDNPANSPLRKGYTFARRWRGPATSLHLTNGLETTASRWVGLGAREVGS